MREIPVFYEWLNEITDEIAAKADSLCMSSWEAAGLRDDAPQKAKDAFQEFVKEEKYWRHNTTETRPL